LEIIADKSEAITKIRNEYNMDLNLHELNRVLDEIKINQGIILQNINSNKTSTNLQDYEFKVFSQFGEDGIIQKIINSIEIKNKTFIEFGVEDFTESNCRFLLMKDNWKGFVIDGDSKNIEKLKRSYYFWKHSLKGVSAFIDKENINNLLNMSEFDDDVGILSIDIDGNDYYILESIDCIRPRILICEYNALYGPVRKISTVYSADFNRFKHHYTAKHYGASLGAITYLNNKKGYSLVGVNSASHNAFFVRDDLVNDRLEVKSVEEYFSYPKMRGSINREGRLEVLDWHVVLAAIRGEDVFNVETNQIEKL